MDLNMQSVEPPVRPASLVWAWVKAFVLALLVLVLATVVWTVLIGFGTIFVSPLMARTVWALILLVLGATVWPWFVLVATTRWRRVNQVIFWLLLVDVVLKLVTVGTALLGLGREFYWGVNVYSGIDFRTATPWISAGAVFLSASCEAGVLVLFHRRTLRRQSSSSVSTESSAPSG